MFYKFYGYIFGEHVAGVVQAETKSIAKLLLKDTYEDYDSWKNKTLEKIDFDKDHVCEVYYGC